MTDWDIVDEDGKFPGSDPAAVAGDASAQPAISNEQSATSKVTPAISRQSDNDVSTPVPAIGHSARNDGSSVVKRDTSSDTTVQQRIPDQPQSALTRERQASANRTMLEAALTARNNEQPQLGWNPTTGEPWFAVRSYAENAYPALYGKKKSVFHRVSRMMPDFVLRYERFPAQRYVLIWPEFVDPGMVRDMRMWNRFDEFRLFLEEWASLTGNVRMMDVVLEEFLRRPEYTRRGLKVPDGFVLSPNLGSQNATASARSRTPPQKHRSPSVRRHGRERGYGSVRGGMRLKDPNPQPLGFCRPKYNLGRLKREEN